ncbi:hypothetical protein LSH36_570g07019 [Paralvinella palmiformis]|uniref:Citrate transporter-like domain-containing protein n=1 Tax=Paralvinella palmiformis TaxID=53620 RepID=A0AAD9J5P1_9ANNE|nr:hypothetical protein LSH36_570g07019 [Paralvinella palmiformis]
MDAGNYVSCDQNTTTNGTMSPEFYDLADTYKVVVGSLIFFVMIPLMRLNLTVFPLGSLFAVMLGALLMVLFQIVRQEEVYDVIAHQGSLTAVFLIIGILIIAQYVEREQILVGILRKLLLPSLRFENYLVRICTVVFFFAALFSNDASGTILTPIVLQVWEAQERPHNELETLILAIITSANIGAMVTVFSSLQMVLIATKTNNVLFKESRLDMRVCFMYLLPVAVILWMVNTCFLVLHHRIRTRGIEKSKLVSEPSQSEQEMAGLTARESNGNINGYLPNSGRTELATFDGVYFGPAANQHSDDRISIPCQLETIPEDDILEISSSQNTSLRDSGDIEMPSPQHARYDNNDNMESSVLGGSDASSSSSDDDERDRMRNTDENLHQLNISYRPGALQSQNLTTAGDSCTSLIQSLEKQSLVISQRFGIYHSLRAFSVTHFLPSSGIGDDGGSLLSSDSVVFLVTLSVLMITIVALLLVSCYYIMFDLGKC